MKENAAEACVEYSRFAFLGSFPFVEGRWQWVAPSLFQSPVCETGNHRAEGRDSGARFFGDFPFFMF